MIAIPFLKGKKVDLMVKTIPEGLKQKLGKTQKKNTSNHRKPITITQVLNLAGTDLAELLVSTETLVHEIKRELDVKTTIPSTLQCLCYGDQHPGFIRWQFYSLCFNAVFFLCVATEGRFKGDFFCWRIFGVDCFFFFFFGGGGMMCWVTLQDVL